MPLPNWTIQQVYSQLYQGGSLWTGNITYAFPTSTVGMTSLDGELAGFQTLNAAQKVMATLAISLWDDVIAPDMFLTNSTASNIEFGYSTTFAGYAQSYFPTSGTVWFNSTQADLVTPVIGQHGLLTFIHELGHALSLDHMGNYNGAGPATPSSIQDSTVLSIMSYFGPSWGPGVANGEGLVMWADWIGTDLVTYEPQTPMLNDIMAVQNIYGVETTTRTGDTTYGFHSTLSGVSNGIYDFTQNLHPIMCLFDSSGNDTLDVSGWNTPSTIDLNPGAFSSSNDMTSNISIAYTAVIENAIGGGGNDILTGNTGDNILAGGTGNDILSGGAGVDQIYGGAGADTLIGGADIDYARYDYALSAISVRLDTGQGSLGEALGDTLSGIEGVVGSNDSDLIIGSDTAGSDVLYGIGGSDAVYGLGGNDYIFGGDGNDNIFGGVGSDYIDGGTGFDFARYDTALGGVYAALYTGQGLSGEATGDVLVSIEGLLGSAFGDVLIGDANANTLYGNAGNDSLYGLGSNDYLFGGQGSDSLYGGAGNDGFIFDLADFQVGIQDIIQDFGSAVANIDTLYFTGIAANTLIEVAVNGGVAISTTSLNYAGNIFIANTSLADVTSHILFI